ncbi:hypothetical protein [Mycobacterium tilburgii]|uniref:hypothetical protein n=1 Tax=Mycobacterium tilburgii TaxID=44467 RepID=UPI001642568C|nr:hypothetical protein [Mycobacterium tilburgii]
MHRLPRACVRDPNLIPPDRSIDVSFHQLNGNKMPVLDELYRRGDVEVTPKVRAWF